jgi:hypothetical protein
VRGSRAAAPRRSDRTPQAYGAWSVRRSPAPARPVTAAPGRATPSREQPGCRPRGRAEGARASVESGTVRSRGTRRPARGSPRSGPRLPARRPSDPAARQAPARSRSLQAARPRLRLPRGQTAESDRGAGPTYRADGRKSRPVRFCSRMWADQPATLEQANIAGASGGGISATSRTIAE